MLLNVASASEALLALLPFGPAFCQTWATSPQVLSDWGHVASAETPCHGRPILTSEVDAPETVLRCSNSKNVMLRQVLHGCREFQHMSIYFNIFQIAIMGSAQQCQSWPNSMGAVTTVTIQEVVSTCQH